MIARKNTQSLDAAFGEAIGEMVRDTGHVMWCAACKRAEMPGTIRCGVCRQPLVRAQVAMQRRRLAKEMAA